MEYEKKDPNIEYYNFSYSKTRDASDVERQIKSAGAFVDFHDSMLAKFFIKVPKEKVEIIQDLEKRLR